jgi:predicted membrane protein
MTVRISPNEKIISADDKMDLLQMYYIFGSFSLGYGLLRVGFPASQNYTGEKKLIIGFIIGVLIFWIALIANIAMQTENFYVLAILITATIFILFYAKRRVFSETDPEIIVERKTRIVEDQVIQQMDAKETKPRITFEDGLMVKGKSVQETKTKKQVFKEKEGNILNTLQDKTSELENEDEVKKKEDVLEKLRNSARQISDTKKAKTKEEDEEEIEEELLSDIGEEKTSEEEEY